jgi:hypothetical protein
MIIHMDTTTDTSQEEVISSFYICRICECLYAEASSVDCSSCNNVSCVMMYQGDTLENAIMQKRNQYGIIPEKEEECIELKHLKYKSMVQGGTRKDIGGRPKSDSINTLDKFLEETTASNNTGRWNRLDKTIKLQKMTDFADIYAAENEYTDEDKASLMVYLRDCLDKKKLIRVKDVEYDNESDRLIAIPGLQYNRTSRKHTIKNADSKRSSVTKSLPQRKTVKLKRDTEK